MICISIGKIELLAKVNELRPDLVEIRYDLIPESPAQVSTLLNKNIRQIATCRPGSYTDKQRMELLKSAVDSGAAYVDLEIESEIKYHTALLDYASKKNCDVVISYHNFEKTPSLDDLKGIFYTCFEKGASLAKIACMAQNKEDSERLMSLYNLEGRKVVLGMGEEGKITRIKAIELGAEFTFLSVDGNEKTAPGQLSYEEYYSIKKID